VLKRERSSARVVAVEPARAPVLGGGRPGLHRIHGIGAGFVPGILNREVIDEIVAVSDEHAYETARAIAEREGLLVGISSGANVWAAIQVAGRMAAGASVVTVLCDTGERYLSMAQSFR
jgi:cysteine synthase A